MSGLRKTVAVTIAFAAFTAAVSWGVGLGPIESGLMAAVAVTLGAAQAVRSRLEPEPAWPPRRLDPQHLGTRREVEQLRWTMTGRRRLIGEPVLRRLRAVAQHRLARHGVDLHDPAQAERVTALVGATAYSVLITDQSNPVDYATFERCVAALERLDDHPDGSGSGTGWAMGGGR